jgi:putative redox protein
MYAERKGIALQSVEVQLSHERIHAKDCEDCETKKGMLDVINSEIHLKGDLDEAQRRRLLEIATRCPVHRILTSEIKIRTTKVSLKTASTDRGKYDHG